MSASGPGIKEDGSNIRACAAGAVTSSASDHNPVVDPESMIASDVVYVISPVVETGVSSILTYAGRPSELEDCEVSVSSDIEHPDG